MESDAELARQHLELARATSNRLWAEYRAFAETLDPARGVAGSEELRRLGEASESTRMLYAAEQALFVAENGTPGVVGEHGEYQWITMVECDVSKLLRMCPDVVLGKYLAVTSSDSGTLRLTERESVEGWWTTDSAKVFRGTSWRSPEYRDDWKRLPTALALLRSHVTCQTKLMMNCCAGYDEWYVFGSNQCCPENSKFFVNWSGFRFYNPGI